MIYRKCNSLLILITNTQLGYVGLDEVDCLDGDIIGTVFLEEHQLKEKVSTRWLQMKPETLIRRISGTTYAQGAAVWSPANVLTYRRKVAGAGTVERHIQQQHSGVCRLAE